MQKSDDARRRLARRVYWEYNKVWLQSRLFITVLLIAVGIYCGLRDYGRGNFWPGIIALCLCLLFFFLPFSVTRFVAQGWQDVRKNRISSDEIVVRFCKDDSPHTMLSRGSSAENIRKLQIIAEDGKSFFAFVKRYSLFDGSAMSGRRYRVEYLTKSHLVIGLTPLSPLPKRVCDQARLQRLAPLMNQYK